MTDHAPNAPASVYLMYDADDVVLYVGRTKHGIGRTHSHAGEKDWWPQVVHIEVEHFPNRSAALAREEQLILALQPPHNSKDPVHWRTRHQQVAEMRSAGMTRPAIAEALGIAERAVDAALRAVKRRSA